MRLSSFPRVRQVWVDFRSRAHCWFHHVLAKMLIKVKTLTGKEIEIDIEPTDKVERIKVNLETRLVWLAQNIEYPITIRYMNSFSFIPYCFDRSAWKRRKESLLHSSVSSSLGSRWTTRKSRPTTKWEFHQESPNIRTSEYKNMLRRFKEVPSCILCLLSEEATKKCCKVSQFESFTRKEKPVTNLSVQDA